jgi:hypothetical protein
LQPEELAEEIAVWLLDKDYLTDREMMERFEIDDFELIKAKNILCRFHGIAIERPQNIEELTMPVLMLTQDFKGDDGRELIRRVFHEPGYKTKKRAREQERKEGLKGEVKEVFQTLQEEWGKLFKKEH